MSDPSVVWDNDLRELARRIVDKVNREALRDPDIDVKAVEFTLVVKAIGKDAKEVKFGLTCNGDGDSFVGLGQFALGYDR